LVNEKKVTGAKDNIIDINVDELRGENSFYKNQLKNHSIQMFKRQTLSRQS